MFNSEEDFKSFARGIAALNNLPIETALDYAAFIGDTPELDSDGIGLVVIRDADNKVIARIRLPESQ